MKIWITRDNNYGLVETHLREPEKDSDGDFWGDYFTRFAVTEFKRGFGFTPRKGSCKQYELTLKEIK